MPIKSIIGKKPALTDWKNSVHFHSQMKKKLNKNGLSMKEQSISKNISVRLFLKVPKYRFEEYIVRYISQNKFLMVYKLLGRIQLSYQCD